jgi:competence protein ComEA
MDAPLPEPRRVPALLAAVAVGLAVLLAYRAASPHWQPEPSTQLKAGRGINLNRATVADLMQIPGVGPGMAQTIVAERDAKGSFSSLEELDRLPGVGPKTVESLRPWLSVSPGERPAEEHKVETLQRKPAAAGKTINVNTATAAELDTLPGLGPKLVERFLAERSKAPFKDAEDLRRVPGIGPKTIEKLKPLVRFKDN